MSTANFNGLANLIVLSIVPFALAYLERKFKRFLIDFISFKTISNCCIFRARFLFVAIYRSSDSFVFEAP